MEDVDVIEWVKPPVDVGVIGELGEFGSYAPDESFVLFFLRNPKVGMRLLCWRGMVGDGRVIGKRDLPAST